MRRLTKVLIAGCICLTCWGSTVAYAATAYDNVAISKVSNYVNVRQQPNTTSPIVGKIYNNCAATILSSVMGEDGIWYQMQSGSVTGYIKAEYFITGAEAEAVARQVGKVYATVTSQTALRLREKPDLQSNIIEQLAPGARFVVLEESGDFAKLAVDADLTGYASKQFVKIEVDFDKAVTLEEEQARLAEESKRKQDVTDTINRLDELKKQDPTIPIVIPPLTGVAEESNTTMAPPVSPAKNPNQSNSNQSNSNQSNSNQSNSNSAVGPVGPGMKLSGEVSSATRDAIVAYARQFLGNPYVYGGTSLTNGADCSGFTQSIYSHFGITIGRSSRDQAVNGNGRQISWENAKPGDLLFYGSSDYINHVAMYIGGGQVIHASTPESGITISPANYRIPCKAMSFLD